MSSGPAGLPGDNKVYSQYWKGWHIFAKRISEHSLCGFVCVFQMSFNHILSKVAARIDTVFCHYMAYIMPSKWCFRISIQFCICSVSYCVFLVNISTVWWVNFVVFFQWEQLLPRVKGEIWRIEYNASWRLWGACICFTFKTKLILVSKQYWAIIYISFENITFNIRTIWGSLWCRPNS